MQRKEWLCNHFIDSLKSKGRQNETEQEKISFSARFIDALISVDEDHKNETNEDPQNAHKATSEPATKRLEVERSTLRETETHDCEETFKVVKGLPNARKRSLIMSIFGRLMGLDDCDVVNAKLSDMPKEANNFDLTKQYEGSTALEVSSYSSGIVINHTHETCATVAVSKLNKELNGLTNRQQGSQNKTVVANQDHLEMPEIKFGRDSVVFKKAAGIDNHGFDCNETESKQATPDQIDVTNVDKVYASQVMPESSQIHCGVESGTLMNGETDFKSTSPATPGTKTVKAWLKDFNLYKVITLFSFAL